VAGILFVCTGNASRSVMAEAMLRVLAPGWEVASTGTHSIDGQPMSWRTREGLHRLGYTADDHRSRQARDGDLASADLIAVFEAFQLAWVRREHPAAAPRTGALRHLATTLPAPARPGQLPAGGDGGLAGRVASLHLEGTPFSPLDEVADPGGQEVDAYLACAVEVHELVMALAERLGPAPDAPFSAGFQVVPS
jgi:protein-tyrosine-phosphatase